MARLKDASFDLQLNGSKAQIVRKVEFEGGDTITFNVGITDFHGLTIAELHQKSARHVINLLEEWLKPPAS